MCLSAFLVIAPEEEKEDQETARNSVLLGHLNPAANWDHIGALDEKRIQTHSKGWMIPSSHLIYRESPQNAARRILREQLGIPDMELSGPEVVSETYPSMRHPDLEHWDLEFIFKGRLSRDTLPKSNAWVDLKFVDLSKVTKKDITRSHEDILRSSGFKIPE